LKALTALQWNLNSMYECEYGDFFVTIMTSGDQSIANKAPLPGSAQNKLAVTFCAKNCEKMIAYAISSAKKSFFSRQGNGITIVVDGFSTDNTREVAKEAGASLVIQQPSSKFPGKGMAMKAGLEAAIKAEVDAIIFLDADIKNLTPEWIDLLSEPVLSRGYDMARGYYQRHPRDAEVTKPVVKPMLSVFFPELTTVVQQPLAEIYASTKAWKASLNKTERPPDGWGIDVWFLIAAATSGFKID
jgi:glycosyltransferase involved in cell wall biosynthesis